jgi:hypothetical protein
MQNKHPKSELPALKEKASKAKDAEGLRKSIEKESSTSIVGRPRKHRNKS